MAFNTAQPANKSTKVTTKITQFYGPEGTMLVNLWGNRFDQALILSFNPAYAQPTDGKVYNYDIKVARLIINANLIEEYKKELKRVIDAPDGDAVDFAVRYTSKGADNSNLNLEFLIGKTEAGDEFAQLSEYNDDYTAINDTITVVPEGNRFIRDLQVQQFKEVAQSSFLEAVYAIFNNFYALISSVANNAPSTSAPATQSTNQSAGSVNSRVRRSVGVGAVKAPIAPPVSEVTGNIEDVLDSIDG